MISEIISPCLTNFGIVFNVFIFKSNTEICLMGFSINSNVILISDKLSSFKVILLVFQSESKIILNIFENEQMNYRHNKI